MIEQDALDGKPVLIAATGGTRPSLARPGARPAAAVRLPRGGRGADGVFAAAEDWGRADAVDGSLVERIERAATSWRRPIADRAAAAPAIPSPIRFPSSSCSASNATSFIGGQDFSFSGPNTDATGTTNVLNGASANQPHDTGTTAERAGVDTDYVVRLIDAVFLAPQQRSGCPPETRGGACSSRHLMTPVCRSRASPPRSRAVPRCSTSWTRPPSSATPRCRPRRSARCANGRRSLRVLAVIREAIGLEEPSPDDRLSEDELAIVPFIELQVVHGFRPKSIERLLRVNGESTRRIAETEAAWWYAEVMSPRSTRAKVLTTRFRDVRESEHAAGRTAVLAMYHTQQARAWTANMINGFEATLVNAGLHSRLERPPAICFLDITGYTRLTQERGDDAAADLAAKFARLVERSSVRHGGKPIKWLGRRRHVPLPRSWPRRPRCTRNGGGHGRRRAPSGARRASCRPRDLPGAVTTSVRRSTSAARIAEYARPGEVLVSRAVADASREMGIAFQDIGPVELKVVGSTTHVLRAHLA